MTDTWELYYWPGCPGRGEFVRLMFEDTGTPYKYNGNSDVIVNDIIKGEGDFFPHFAPPMIKKGDFSLSQTHVICRYLAEQWNLLPGNAVDNAHAEQINLSCHDFYTEGMLAFHGIDPVGPYKSQEKETQPYIDRFLENRFPRWLKYLERVLVANNGGDSFAIGSKISYTDLTLFHVLRATEAQFPDVWAKADYMPKLKAFKERIAARPNIAAYLKSDRACPFVGDSMM